MGIFDTVRNQAVKVKLQGDMVLLDREITSRKGKFGIDLYQLLVSLEGNKQIGGIIKLPSFFSATENLMKQPFEDCRFDVQQQYKDKEIKELELLHIASARERSKPAITTSQIATKAGSRIQDAASEAKLQVDIALLDRSIQQRKEKFGIEVYDIARASVLKDTTTTTNTSSAVAARNTNTTNSPKKSKSAFSLFGSAAKKVVSTNLSKLNTNEADIKNCILLAVRDIDFLVQQKTNKQGEIDKLVST